MLYDITLLTDSRYVAPVNAGWYELNILKEDQLITAALEKRGFQVTRINWDNADFDWKQTRAAVFRTTWDYFHRFAEFSAWLDRVSSETQFINPLSTIRWNMDKHYLGDLQSRNIRIPPTVFIKQDDNRTLSQIATVTSWNEFILKPAVSGAARHTYRFSRDEITEHEIIYRQLIAGEAMLLQEFQSRILTKGEVALMCFNGKYSHAVLKRAKAGDFRVQDDFGGSVHDYTPGEEEIRFAEEVVRVCHPTPVYARVDLIWDSADQLCVSELELIEPELWIRNFPPAAETFAEALAAVLIAPWP